ncbi:hypothetical protein K2Y11_08405 [bacterium]|nr:hypothetical protein [bacterium]
MRFFQAEDTTAKLPLIATPDDLRNPDFVKAVVAADVVVALDQCSREMWYLWGEDVVGQLGSGDVKELTMAYIMVDFRSDQFKYTIDAVHRIKEGVANGGNSSRRQNRELSMGRIKQSFWVGQHTSQ